MSAPEFKPGDRISHHLMPGFVMTVLEVAACETDDHQALKIIDPAGTEDWLCERDIVRR